MQESNDGSTKHGPWYKMENSVMPNQEVAIHMLTPFFSFELKTEEEQVTFSNQLYWRCTFITELKRKAFKMIWFAANWRRQPKTGLDGKQSYGFRILNMFCKELRSVNKGRLTLLLSTVYYIVSIIDWADVKEKLLGFSSGSVTRRCPQHRVILYWSNNQIQEDMSIKDFAPVTLIN